MTALVRFRVGGAEYAIAVEHAREVRSGTGIVPVPGARPGVVGVLPRARGGLTVVSTLGSGGERQVLVLEADGCPFGLLVEEVLGVVAVAEESIAAPPSGQEAGLVSGLVPLGGSLVMLVDASALARALA